MKKVSVISVEVSFLDGSTEQKTMLTVPWKERFRILFSGKLLIKVRKGYFFKFKAKPDEEGKIIRRCD